MSSTSFRLESFRPWNPFQDKAQPSRDSPYIYRYPSPVSISATPPPSYPSNRLSTSQKLNSHSSDRHPLPARPPAEVCFDGCLDFVVQTAGHEPGHLGSIASDSTHIDTLNPNDILQLQDLPGPEDLGHAPISGSIGLSADAERRSPDFDPSDLEAAVIAGQLPQDVDSGNHILSREPPGIETIDPTILNDHACPGVGQIQAAETISGIATCRDRSPPEFFHFPIHDPPLQCSRENAKETADPNRQFTKINKCSSIGKRCSKIGAGRSRKGPRRCNSVSFPTVRAQFLALPVEDRLQFLSWLFESTLSHCVSSRPNTDVASVSSCASSQDQSSSNTEPVEAQQPPSRKGLPWSMEENCLLVNLREEQNLAWSEVTRLFAQKFPGRSKGSLQVYWSTTLKNQRLYDHRV
ncbi:hypothetical protein POX_c04212 [Penicillium oxalicum]|uniref:hypothetical protein n=1 Tax=Penicillium oxalicum TaxID=69781 RepID=UPI0020B83237|nr:hypothetical protein POX_c04212 [Penicillium oxalicum]KAI2791355.1 hypothetical protein POX_c04212 [Penicillium oxalicum]